MEFLESDLDGMPGTSVPASHIQPGSSISSSTGQDEELRRSVRDALGPGSHR